MKTKALSLQRTLLLPSTFIIFLCLTSCQTVKQTAGEVLMESGEDPKTGAQVFERPDAYSPYEVNVGGLVKARKEAKRRKRFDVLRNY